MKKILVFLAAQKKPKKFTEWLLGSFCPRILNQCFEITVNIIQVKKQPSRWDAVLEIKAREDSVINALAADDLHARTSSIIAYRAEEMIEKDDGLVRGSPTAGVKLLCPWSRHQSLSARKCRRHWDEHVPLANRVHIGVCCYVRNWIEDILYASTQQPPDYQGMAVQYFNSYLGLKEESFDKPESEKVIQKDIAVFIDQFELLIGHEYFLTDDK